MEELQLFTLRERASNQITVQLQANGQQLSMELDTGAAVSQDTKESLFPDVLKSSCAPILVKQYKSQEIKVNMQYGQQTPEQLSLVLVKGGGPSLFVRNCLGCIRLD